MTTVAQPSVGSRVRLPTDLTEETIMNSNVNTASRAFLTVSRATLLACAWIAATALADDGARTETVRFQDLNTDTSAGVQALYGRIHSAAERVCSQSDPLLQAAVSACVRKAVGTAIENLSLPQLTAYYRMKSGDRTQPITANR
jgi:UrcA family protein